MILKKLFQNRSLRGRWIVGGAMLMMVGMMGCSLEKDKWINRKYHEMNTHFNGYFNGYESYREGVMTLEDRVVDNYDLVLPIFKTGTEEEAKQVFSKMDRAITKATKMIQKHSMKFRGEERNEWIDDCYMLIGKARYYKKEHLNAIEAFNYVISNYPETHEYFDAHIWLARTHAEMKNFESGIYALDLIVRDKALPKTLKGAMYAAYAELYRIEEEYDQAIAFLQDALKWETNKDQRYRMTFILAQLYQVEGGCNRAIPLFAEVAKSNVPYILEFNSKIKMALCIDRNGRQNASIIAALKEMLKDDKNREYFDQIHYALGEIAYQQGELEKAIGSFEESVLSSQSNVKQKSLSYLRLGEIYFEETEFRRAQAYYDSAMTFLPEDYPNYLEIKNLNENLGELVGHLLTVEEQDSLLRLVNMSERDRNAFIDNYIDEIKEQERLEKQRAMAGFGQMMAVQNENRNRQEGATQQGGWYFYNPTTIAFGQSEFVRIWGDRMLEDNWRRRNKTSTGSSDSDDASKPDTLYIETEDGLLAVTKYDRAYYLYGLPFDSASQKVCDSLIEHSLYQIGSIYKEKLLDPRKGAAALEDLLRRYPNTPIKIRIYYNLYRTYAALKFIPETTQYKELILAEAPDSEYAMIIKDPDYLAKKAAEENVVFDRYRAAYNAFKNGQLRTSQRLCEEGLANYGNHAVSAKFALLRSMSMRDRGKDDVLASLEKVVADYARTPEADEAARILAHFKTPPPAEKGAIEEGESSGLNKEEQEEALDISMFQPGDKSQHFVILTVPIQGLDLNALNIAFSDFNRNYFELENLSVKSIYMDSETQMISIRSFQNDEKAMKYYNNVVSEPFITKLLDGSQVSLFAITVENFGVLYRGKQLPNYLAFFEQHYLE